MLTLGQPTSPSGLCALLFYKTGVSAYLRAVVLNFLEGGHFAPHPWRGIWKFLETFLAVTLVEGKGMLLVASTQKPGMLLDMLPCLGQPLHTHTHNKNVPDQNVSKVCPS